jgi:hypothetical protein
VSGRSRRSLTRRADGSCCPVSGRSRRSLTGRADGSCCPSPGRSHRRGAAFPPRPSSRARAAIVAGELRPITAASVPGPWSLVSGSALWSGLWSPVLSPVLVSGLRF